MYSNKTSLNDRLQLPEPEINIGKKGSPMCVKLLSNKAKEVLMNNLKSSKHLKYDARENYISLSTYTLDEIPNLQRELSQ